MRELSFAHICRCVAQLHRAEIGLVAAAVVWCGYRWGLSFLLTLLVCSSVCTAIFPETSERCRRNASIGLVLGSAVLPTLFVAEASSVPAIYVAFRLTWWSGIFASALRVWRFGCSSSPLVNKAIVAFVGFFVLAGLVAALGDALLLPALLVLVVCLGVVQRAMPLSFTFGEAVILSELCAVLFHFMLFSVVLGVTPLPVMTSKLRKIIAIGLFSAVAISTLNLLLSHLLLSTSLRTWFDHRSACHSALTVCLVALMLEWMSMSIGQNSLQWLWEYVTSHTATPLKFIVYYLLVLVPALILAPDGRKTSMKQVLVRKYFHVLALVIFVPTILVNIRFMALAFAVALSVFIVVEALRISDVPFVTSIADSFMKSYVDDRDEGTAILTHIYLLLGCALPVFFNYFVLRGIFSANSLLIALSGVTVTGLGDAMASFCGIYFGRHRWIGSKKTMEGTAGMIVATFVFQALCLWTVGFHNLSGSSWIRLLVADILVSLLEAKTDQIDNLLLPLYHVALLQMV